eukprot:gnl/MRDRNA2_/MRDRNA2_187776_c0_seq1.p1 gnl/MRDRNA2_/MRDRNA2_187776_c0~~gnl/MRDRNA2_/MRDRNA2_187776_c0_seq1.p1  ORF type:complete len:404 (+),score=77.02 gnl/MRDRNA2_/MRDRNA2_187776_c0_seq1:27-1238(+)
MLDPNIGICRFPEPLLRQAESHRGHGFRKAFLAVRKRAAVLLAFVMTALGTSAILSLVIHTWHHIMVRNSVITLSGIVTSWDQSRGFGFIRPHEGGENLFVHAKSLLEGLSIAEGDKVLFKKKRNSETKKYEATEVKSATQFGVLSAWDDSRGFGFITPNGGPPNIFVHSRSFGDHKVNQGDSVAYEIEYNDDSNKYEAIHVKRCSRRKFQILAPSGKNKRRTADEKRQEAEEQREWNVACNRKFDPDDWKIYSFPEIFAKYQNNTEPHDIKTYWDYECKLANNVPLGDFEDDPEEDPPDELEKRIDPDDGKAYTYAEIVAHYGKHYSADVLRDYWENQCKVTEPEKRIDPDDGKVYTWKEIFAQYKEHYTLDDLKAYWKNDCKPVKLTAGGAPREPKKRSKM